MKIEYEATFPNVNKDDIRAKLKSAGAVLMRPEFLQRRIPFWLPGRVDAETSWVRVRDEGGSITMSIKTIDGLGISDQRELCLSVNSFDDAVEFLKLLGCDPKSYQETKRELWVLDGVEITLDEWPFLEPFVEVEGNDESSVMLVSEKIGFKYDDALFCAVGKLYEMKYGVSSEDINVFEKLVFDMPNPFPALMR